jgi:hypothetical protein
MWPFPLEMTLNYAILLVILCNIECMAKGVWWDEHDEMNYVTISLYFNTSTLNTF